MLSCLVWGHVFGCWVLNFLRVLNLLKHPLQDLSSPPSPTNYTCMKHFASNLRGLFDFGKTVCPWILG